MRERFTETAGGRDVAGQETAAFASTQQDEGRSIERRYAQLAPSRPAIEQSQGKRKIVGYAAVFDSPSSPLSDRGGDFVEIIRPGAFTDSIDQDDVRALFNHDSNWVLGRSGAGTLRLYEDAQGLRYEIDPPESDLAEHVLECIRRGDVSGSSFAFRTLQDDWSARGGQRTRALVKVKLFDVGPVTYPAYSSSTTGIGRSGTPRLDAARQRMDQISPGQMALRERMLKMMQMDV